MSNKSSENCKLWKSYNNNDVGKFRELINSGHKFNHLNEYKNSLVEYILLDYTNMDKNLLFFDEIFTDYVDLNSFNNHGIFLSMTISNPNPISI